MKERARASEREGEGGNEHGRTHSPLRRITRHVEHAVIKSIYASGGNLASPE